MPPELLVIVPSLDPFFTNASLCCFPLIRVPAKPLPTSNPFVAGMESIAWARSASNLSKQGSPQPTGTFRQTHDTTPPKESWRCFAAIMASSISRPNSTTGQRTIVESTTSRVKEPRNSASCSKGSASSPTELTHATISILCCCFSHFSAIAPAATRPSVERQRRRMRRSELTEPMVSLAEARPPPLLALMPYLQMYV